MLTHSGCEVALSRYSSMSVEELVRACAESNDGGAWEDFVARLERPISLSIKRTACQWGMDPGQFVDDLLQETYLKLCADSCRLLLEFAHQHPEREILAYIKTIAINVAHDQFKSLHSQKRGGGEVDQLLEDFDPAAHGGSLGGPEAIQRELLLKEIDGQLQNCAAGSNQERDCLIFWFHYLQGMSAKTIAALETIQLTAKGVEAVIFRLTRCLREKLGGPGVQDLASP
jgi:RNA polymerase sigma-70 factor (ECF subfamily)